MKYTWQKNSEPLVLGIHTTETCRIIDDAFDKYRQGISSFHIILIVYRHGKSDISSRYLPAHFLGEFPDDEVIVVSHNASKAFEFSKFGRKLVKSQEYRRLYPHINLSMDQHNVEEWGIEGYTGKAQYFGIGGGSAGKGGNLIVIDDYFGNRADAESELMREKVWEAFTNDIMTRRAPKCIVILVVTPWHCDDPVQRINKKMKESKDFPRFKTTIFPAFSPSYKTKLGNKFDSEELKNEIGGMGILFPERFSKEWYITQRATLGRYGSAGLMYCNPKPRLGNMFRIDKVKYYDELPEGIVLVRGWDIASSKKERTKNDPDYTVGAQIGVILEPTAIPGITVSHLYIEDIVRGQWEASKRKKIMTDTSIADGFIRVGIEAYAGYKDAYTELRDVLHGIRHVEKMQLPGDKVAKASVLEPIFEAGNVYIKKDAMWSQELLDEFSDFPGGKHDDQVDAVTVAYYMAQKSGMGLYTAEMYNEELMAEAKAKTETEGT